jgi:predicted transcriptional regulator
MSTDDSGGDEQGVSADGERDGVRNRLEQEAERAAEQFDDGIVELLSWVLDTETRARIYVYLRQNPASTSEEVANGTGLYPSTVREALAELTEDGTLERRKRESGGAGNNPYEYTAMPPSELVGSVVEELQAELNTVFNLDCHLGLGDEERAEPVTITVEERTDGAEGDADTADR